MSKCDLQIVFDRNDRQYRGGDEVSGTVHVQVNRDVQCDGLKVEHFWQTHGRGNRARGKEQSTVLYRGPWQAGETASYPFRFTAPNGPPTYRGRYLNIDHYVRARVDVPWAIDPKCQEEYVLLPSGRPYGNRPTSPGQAKRGLLNLGAPAGCAMVGIGVFLLIPFGLILIPLGCVLLFFSMRKILAEKKIGKVALRLGSTHAAPGGSVPLRLVFTPRTSPRLNGVTVQLTGMERCVSGSGTNRSTHTHKFYNRTIALAGGRDLTALHRTEINGTVQIPEIHAYSFRASDNEVLWTVDVRIDIPLWPDWTEKCVLTVRPTPAPTTAAAPSAEGSAAAMPLDDEWVELATDGETEYFPEETDTAVAPLDLEAAFAEPHETEPQETEPQETEPQEDGSQESEPYVSLPTPVDDAPPDDEATFDVESFDEAPPDRDAIDEAAPQQEAVPDAAPEEELPPAEPPPAAAPAAGTADLHDIVEQLDTASRYGSEREKIVEEHADLVFSCEIEIDKIERTYSYTPDERFRDGRTVIGVVVGTDCEVSMLMTAARNDALAEVKPGSMLTANGTLLKWSSVYDRIEMQEAVE